MAEKTEIEVTGKSKYEVAHMIAYHIAVAEHESLTMAIKKQGRNYYLNAVVQATEALQGILPR